MDDAHDADTPRSPEEVRAFFAAWVGTSNARDWGAFADLVHPDAVLYDPLAAGAIRGRAQVLVRTQQQYEPCPDGHLEVIGEPFTALDASALAYRWRFTGTHLRPLDPPGFAPTGDRVALDGMSLLRFRERKVIELSLFFDATTVARQVLAAPRLGSPVERVIVLFQRVRAGLRRRRG